MVVVDVEAHRAVGEPQILAQSDSETAGRSFDGDRDAVDAQIALQRQLEIEIGVDRTLGLVGVDAETRRVMQRLEIRELQNIGKRANDMGGYLGWRIRRAEIGNRCVPLAYRKGTDARADDVDRETVAGKLGIALDGRQMRQTGDIIRF